MFEVKLLCPEAHVVTISDALMELDALSVSVEDADAGTDAEQAIFGEPGMPAPAAAWTQSRLIALFNEETTAKNAVSILAAQEFYEGCQILAITPVADQDWVRLTQSQFEPVAVTNDFFIVPTWCEPPQAAKRIIRLDPGLAFGTGTHPTTRMCLKWIATQGSTNRILGRTLDYGCGSGILAIAAKKYSASEVIGVDIDPAAVAASVANAQMNNVEIKFGLPDLTTGGYDTVLANILASPLKVLAPLLCNHTASNGRLILAGILERQTDEIKTAYAPYVQLQVLDDMDGWVLMGA